MENINLNSSMDFMTKLQCSDKSRLEWSLKYSFVTVDQLL